MSSSRNPRRLILGLAFGLALLGLAGLVLLRRGPDPPSTTKAKRGGEAVQPEKEREIHFLNETPVQLEPGQTLSGELKSGEGYRYAFSLEAGQIARIVVEQKGVDVAVRYFRPGREKEIEIDSPNWRLGEEIVYELAESASTYPLNVVCKELSAPPGRYEIRLEEPRAASAQDRTRFDAWRAFQNGELRRRAREYQEAEGKYHDSLGLWRQVGERSWAAAALYRIGWMRQLRGEDRSALEPLSQALDVFKKEKRHLDEALALNRLGQARCQVNDWPGCIEAYEASLPLVRNLGMAWLEASSLSGCGNALAAQGRAQEALDSYRQALAKAREMPFPEYLREQALAHNGMGNLFTYQDRREPARDHLREAVRLADLAGDAEVQASALTRLANIDQRDGQLEEARERLVQALAIHRAAGNRWGEAATLGSLGTVRLLAGETEEAGEAYRSSLAISQDLHDGLGEGFALLNLGRYFYEKGDFRQALAHHERAAELFRKIGSPRGEVSTLFGSARALLELGELDAARERLEKVFSEVEVLRSESELSDLRTSYWASRQHYFDLYVDVLMHLDEKDRNRSGHWMEKAFEINEHRRARGLLDLVSEESAGPGARPGSPLLNQERQLQQEINALQNDILNREREGAGSRPLVELEIRQREILDRLGEVRREIRRQDPGSTALLRSEPLSLARIRTEILDKDTALLVFSLGEKRSFLWHVPFEGEVGVYILPPRAYIERVARTIHDGWSDPVPGKKKAAERWAIRLSRELFGKVAPRLTERRLVFVSDGALEYLPLGALPDPRTLPESGEPGRGAFSPLLARHEIVHLPSASVLSALRKRERRIPFMAKRIGVIADPVFSPDDPRVTSKTPEVARPPADPEELEGLLQRAARNVGMRDFPRLPFTADEAMEIRSLVPKEQRFELLDFAANPDTVRSKELSKCRILHFATHGLLDTRHPELSGLLFSRVDEKGERRQDGGLLLGHQIRDLSLTAELAVLSACETGLGEEVRGEGLVGLTHSFMDAGVPRLVVSLWKVDDKGTSELMRRFYRILLTRDYSPAAALRCAQLSMLKEPRWSSPSDWAAFVFEGEWRWSRRRSGDGGIETPIGATGPGHHPDDDLPPPTWGGPNGCPDDFDF
jgi:CHAT domain-containing protein/tetratricopeptide (TPR) repeat protein